MIKNRGQTSLISLIGVGLAGVLTAFGLYTASNVRTDSKITVAGEEITKVKVEVATVRASYEANYSNVIKRLDNIDDKLDKILLQR